jgi:hypothetical protein
VLAREHGKGEPVVAIAKQQKFASHETEIAEELHLESDAGRAPAGL